MSAYETETKQAKEFVRKTLCVIKQYEKCSEDFGPYRFEVTLKINCLIGLIVTPQQYFAKVIPVPNLLISESDEANWGVCIDRIDYGRNSSKLDCIRNDAHRIAKHIRNSIAHHNRFVLKSYGSDEITHIHFVDYLREHSNEEQKTFEYEFKIEDLVKFAYKYAEFFVESISVD